MPIRSRFFRAGLCAAGVVLLGGLVPRAEALDSGDQSPPANPWLIRTWQTDDGLPDNNVTGLAQTMDGHLWVVQRGAD